MKLGDRVCYAVCNWTRSCLKGIELREGRLISDDRGETVILEVGEEGKKELCAVERRKLFTGYDQFRDCLVGMLDKPRKV